MSEISKRVSDLVKPVLVKVLSAQAYAALVAIPGFGWIFGLPVVRNVVQFIINNIVEWAVAETAVGLSVLWIQLDLSWNVTDAETAAAKLKDMLDNPAKYSAKEQRDIDVYFDDSTINLIALSIKRL